MIKDRLELVRIVESWMTLGCPGMLSIIQLPDKRFDVGIKKIVKRREMREEVRKAADLIVKEFGGSRHEWILKQDELDRIEVYLRLEEKDAF